MKRFFILACFSLLPWVDSLAMDLNAQIAIGEEHWAKGEFAQAESALRKAVEIDAESSAAHARLGGLLMIRDKNSEAITELQEAISLDPENSSLFIALAVAYIHQGYYGMAQAMISQALRLKPGMENARKLREYLDAKMAARETTPPKIQELPPSPAGH